LSEANAYRLYLSPVIKDITFGYCLNLPVNDENQYYGLKNGSIMCKENI